MIPDFEAAKHLATDAMQAQDWRKAADAWMLLRSYFPEESLPWIQGAIALRHLQHWQAAESLLLEAEKHFPNELDIFLQLAETYIALEKYDEATEILERVKPKFAGRYEPEIALLRRDIHAGNLERAEHRAKRLTKLFPTEDEVLGCYAGIAMLREDWPEAVARWTVFREKFPQDERGYIQCAQCLQAAGKTQEARKLRMAYQYGPEWLEAVENDREDHFVAIPQKRNFLSNINLIITKALFNLKSEASRNKLSYLWWIIEPILYMMVFYVVFTFILSRGGDNYILVLLTGMIPFTWFGKGVSVGATSILYGRSILENIKISAMFFPAVAVVQTTLKEMPVFLIFFAFLLIYGIYPQWHWLELLPIILIEAVLIFSFGLLCAIFVPFLKDLQQVIPTFIQFVMFTSGVFYDLDAIPPEYHQVFLLNPMANIIYQHRQILMYQGSLDMELLIILFIEVMVLLILALLFFSYFREKFFKAIMS